MTDILQLIEAGIAVLLAVSPIIVVKYKDAAYALSVVQSFLDLLRNYGKAIADGNLTDSEYMEIGKSFVNLAAITHFDTTIKAEITGLDQTTVDKAVNVVNVITK